MPATHHHAFVFDFQDPGFSAFSGTPDLRSGHRHNEVELAVFEHGAIEALYGGRQMTVLPDRLVVLWGAMPHRALNLKGATIGHGIRVPLPWVLQWKLSAVVLQRLLHFDVIVAHARESPGSDLALVKQWVRFMENGKQEGREIVLLEVHARLRRLVLELEKKTQSAAQAPVAAPAHGGLGLFERILQIVSERYQGPLSISEIARALRISRTHVMRHFRQMTGMSVLDYITQRRVSCAQRLLATTDMKLLDIAFDSGFCSPARFYPCFKKLVGQSPARYRRSVRTATASRR